MSGLLGRFWRWLCGGVRVRIDVPRVRVSGQVTLEGQEAGHEDPADLESLPPEVRAAVEKARQAAPEGATVVKVTRVGPVQVSTQTTTQTYHSLEEMPPELRQRAEAALRGGNVLPSTAMVVSINGERRTFSRIEDVPEPYRHMVEAAQRKVSRR